MIARLKAFYSRTERWRPIAFFALGFLFDVVMLSRIDDLWTLAQQAIYLMICGALIGLELVEAARPLEIPRWAGRFWHHREELLHFLMGSLLSGYALFFFKSASALSSFIYVAGLMALLILNEFKRFKKSQAKVHVAFLSLCLISYFVSLSPILLGFIGTLPFLGAIAGSSLVGYGYFRALEPRLKARPEVLRTHFLYPFIGVHLLFTGLYFAHAIPPVPLSVSYLGIYHGIARTEDGYLLTSTRPSWKFWQNGDQSFLARPGDAVFCFARIFSPTRFRDRLQVRWLYYDERRGWQSSDAIPLPIVGGRNEGYRGFTKKTNYQPGKWRVQVETLDGREIGRIGFTIEADPQTEPREERTEIQ